jgi:galactose mutarotase-like enzyme
VQQTANGSAVDLPHTTVLLPVCSCLQGYPGTLSVTVRYELLSHSAELRITISATTDKPTPGATMFTVKIE